MTAVVPNETPLVENNLEYAPPRDVPRWGPMIAMPQMETDPMCVQAAIPPHLMVIGGREEMMNPAIQRGYQVRLNKIFKKIENVNFIFRAGNKSPRQLLRGLQAW